MNVRRFACMAFWGAWLFLFSTGTAFAASAPSDTERAAARRVGYEGVRAFESGDYRQAVEKLGRAFDVVQIPTLGLWYARSLVKLGRFVEASERYREVIRLEVTEGKVKEQKAAQSQASIDLDELLPKIPTLTIHVSGSTPDCVVTLDGAAVSSSLFGLATPINPGDHQITVKQGDQFVKEAITLGNGEQKSVQLTLKPPMPLARATPPSVVAKSSTLLLGKDPGTDESIADKSSTQKTVGWVSIGLGSAATVFGAISTVIMYSKKSDLDASDDCSGTKCLSTVNDLRTSYNKMRTFSTIGFVVGISGVGLGTTLVLTSPKPQEPYVSARFGINSVSIGGTF